MVFASGVDLVGPVDLLQEHDPQQVMGKGHGGHGQPQIGLLFQRGVHPVGAADEEDDVSGTPGGGLRKIAGQRLAGAFLSLYAHGDEQTSGRQLCPHGIGLSGQRRPDLGRGGRFRQPFLRQLQNCQRAEAAQPLGVFRCSVQIKFFLQLPRADDRHLLHTALL